jgi:hypothetical protein
MSVNVYMVSPISRTTGDKSRSSFCPLADRDIMPIRITAAPIISMEASVTTRIRVADLAFSSLLAGCGAAGVFAEAGSAKSRVPQLEHLTVRSSFALPQ